MSGIADVARAAGVSKSTASRALTGRGYVSEHTRSRVRDAAERLGYVASTNAASLVTGRTHNIALIVPRVNRWYFGSVIEGVERSLISAGFDLTLFVAEPDSRDRESLYAHFLARKRFDGVLAVALEPDDDDIERLRDYGKPFLHIGNELPGITTLGVDNFLIGRMMTEHLLTLGHTDIAFLGRTPPSEPSARDVDDRSAGYLAAMTEAGLAGSARLEPATLTLPDGYAAAASLLADRTSRPSGIVAACDEIGIGTMIAARRLGIAVPAQLSVVAVDGHDYADMFALTTIEQDPAAQGEEAVRLLLEQIAGADARPVRHSAPARLVVRASTAPPAHTLAAV
ncbi:LacI family DNA-binding transcriptional regulator [Microbacterium sp. NPDC078428]|uniref:LacI family DNA-binding transcriptional regulator n=1 Tax=Microbacterium sp. NPDC078428 TaxID=3364190 RepID=UPI0037C9C437